MDELALPADREAPAGWELWEVLPDADPAEVAAPVMLDEPKP